MEDIHRRDRAMIGMRHLTAAPWTEAFVDIEGSRKPAPALRTRAKMLWDEAYFYIGADLAEPALWGTMREHDSVLFHENDFEWTDPR